MKDTLTYLLTAVVDHPDEITVDEVVEESRTIYTVHVHPEDMGKVIGKQGRIIKALRDLIRLVAAKHNTYADIVLAESQAEVPATA